MRLLLLALVLLTFSGCSIERDPCEPNYQPVYWEEWNANADHYSTVPQNHCNGSTYHYPQNHCAAPATTYHYLVPKNHCNSGATTYRYPTPQKHCR